MTECQAAGRARPLAPASPAPSQLQGVEQQLHAGQGPSNARAGFPQEEEVSVKSHQVMSQEPWSH